MSLTDSTTTDAPQKALRLKWFSLPRTAGFVAASTAFASLYLAAGAPTPLLVLLQREWRFPGWVLTVAFAAYALGLLAALLVTGSLSDFVGRKPVLIASLVVELAAMVMFVVAPTIVWVIAARTIQGAATGAATSAFTAAIIELAPLRYKKLGSLIGSAAPAGGLGVGALLTGVAIDYSGSPQRAVFLTLSAIMALSVVGIVLSRETAERRPGAVRSMVPRVAVPVRARGEFAAAAPGQLAAWMLAGLFMGLVPTIIRDILHLDSGLLNGVTVFLEPGTAAIVGLVLGRLAVRRTLLLGSAAVVVGTAIVVAGVVAPLLPLLWVGGVVGGIGFGASFSGTLRVLGPLAEPQQRAGLFAAVFLVAYLAFGVPAVIAGVLIEPLGLLHTIVGYSAAIILASAVGLFVQVRGSLS